MWIRRICGMAGVLGAMALPARLFATDAPDWKALVDAAARGEPQAADELIRTWVDPLAAAVRGADARPYAEQLRIAEALRRLTANLRMQIFVDTLPEADRALFERVRVRDAALLENLFHDDERLRLLAVERIPLEPDTGAGLLLAAKLRDWNAEVIEAALEKAKKLRDASVLRGLRDFSRDILEELRASPARIEDPYVALAYASFLDRAAAILATPAAKEDAALLREMLAIFAEPAYRSFALNLRETLKGYAAIAEEADAATLVRFLAADDLRRLPDLPGETPLLQATGDLALLAMCRIYGIEPAALGLRGAAEGGELGFVDAETRGRAYRRFQLWYETNAKLPADQRQPLTVVDEAEQP